MTTGRTIDYEALAQEAMRSVVRQVLARTAKSGLPGDHHFYISFDTQVPGVSLSKRLKEKYPEEMTIVLQHRFWDLTVTDDRFEVKLTFDGIPERLVVPFGAIKVFFDPSVRYALQFEEPDLTGEGTPAAGGTGGALPAAVTGTRAFGAGPSEADRSSAAHRGTAQRRRTPRKPRLERIDTSEPPAAEEVAQTEGEKPASDGQPAPAAPPTPSRQPDLKPVPAPAPGGAQIVSLSDFRKK